MNVLSQSHFQQQFVTFPHLIFNMNGVLYFEV